MYFNQIRFKYNMKALALVFGIWLMVNACENRETTEGANFPSQREVNRSMEAVNRQMTLDEDSEIEGYARRRGWEMTKTGTGLRYMVLQNGQGLTHPQTGQRVTLTYEISLLDGSVVYSSDTSGPRSFVVGHDHVERGLHEAVTYLKEGDSARIILPSHLAHGLSGDNDKIPPRSSVVYLLKLLDIE